MWRFSAGYLRFARSFQDLMLLHYYIQGATNVQILNIIFVSLSLSQVAKILLKASPCTSPSSLHQSFFNLSTFAK